MREALYPWNFVVASYVITIGGTLAMVGWSLLDMRRAEKRRERSREK